MAKRVITKIPIWGLSVLAVGSIGAPLPGTGKTDIRPNRNFSMSPAVDNAIAQTPQNSIHTGYAPSSATNYMPPLGASSVASQRSILIDGMESGILLNPIITASAMPRKSMIDAGTSQPSQLKNEFELSPAVHALPERTFAPIQPANNRSIYGTSANNAHKVYFPQIELPALGNAAEDLQSFSGAPDQDNRELKINGSYLFYEAPADTETAKKMEAGSGSGGLVEAETLAEAVNQLASGPEDSKLTTPPLQKKPLVFGESLFQTSELTEIASETTVASLDVEATDILED